MINWLKKILSPKKAHLPKNQDEQIIIDLIDFLWDMIDAPNNANDLKTKVKYYKALSFTKKIESLPEIYLLLEEHIVENNSITHYNQQYIHQQISEKYPAVLNYKNFELIIEPIKEQELILCKVFLLQVLEKSSNLTGNYSDPIMLEIQKYLSTPYDFESIVLIEERKNLLDFSNQIFLKVKNSLGIDAITNTYLLIYKQHFQNYHMLESFTAILNVIPKEILAKDLINFPSKQQMLKMLQKQLYSMEEINQRLTKEIVERKKVEEELKHSEDLKTIILETAMDGVILINSEGIVLNWNKQAENILELKREETIGHSIYPLVPRKLRQELKRSFNNYINTGQDQLINKRVETSVNKRNGDIVYIELTIVAIKTKSDYLFNAFFRDITNKKIRDNEIREAKVVAENSAKAKSVFLSNMSHEIRTPLNVILGLTSILQKSDFTNLQLDKKNLDGIQFSADNLLVLINDILDFSKIEAGKLSLHLTDFNIQELITNLSRGFKIKADEKGISYKTIIDPTIPKFIIGDQLRLNQILINLLGNAIKFTQEGEIIIQLKTEKDDAESITINFLVKDTGIGIHKDKLDSIFESFYQVNKPGNHKIEGTGLGLSISKQLIELQGGTLNTKSKPGIGSSFDFSIQYKKSDLKSPESSAANKTITDPSTNLSGMKILVVEDNQMNQFFIKQLLSNWNIDVHMADHGKMALEKLEEFTYDLILMDMHMPVMDGPETTQRIRKSDDPRLNQIPIIACSADVFPESKKKAIESGMNFYLTKPLTEEALEEILLTLRPEITQNHSINNKKTEIIKTTDTQKLCDLSFLKKTFDNDHEIIQSVLQIFIEDTPEDYHVLEKAIADKNTVLTKEIAHKLKSSFKTIGLTKEADILEKIERISNQGISSIEVLELFNELAQTFPKILEEIEHSIAHLASLE